MPLTFANVGEEHIIKKVTGDSRARSHILDMGFVPGESITVISSLSENFIVKVKESRVAISQDVASKIII